MVDTKVTPLVLDTAVEDAVRAQVTAHYAPAYQERIEGYVGDLLATGHYAARYTYLRDVVGPDVFQPERSVFVSGFGLGSEMIVAREFGGGAVYGVEVDHFLVDMCRQRVAYIPEMYPEYYAGDYLAYDAAQFDLVASGHVIEHTGDPELYLAECLRVLKAGGHLLLEFPNRYHHTELHTRLPSFEWLPHSVRNGLLRALSNARSPLDASVKHRYESIVSTNLQQISMGRVKAGLKASGYPAVVLDVAQPLPGIKRCVIQKL